jgi:hypothetical protein
MVNDGVAMGVAKGVTSMPQLPENSRQLTTPGTDGANHVQIVFTSRSDYGLAQ